jgi:hypothetical protein
MKLVSKVIILLALLLSVQISRANELSKNKLISIQATRYEINFQNISKHTLRVIVRDRKTYKTEYFIVNPGQTSEFKGNFDKQKLLDLEVMCVYDIQTFREDISRFQEKILFKNNDSPTNVLKIKRSEWFRFVDNFVKSKNVRDYMKEYDYEQLTIDGKNVKELASEIASKISKDRRLLSTQGSSNYFADVGSSTSRAAVATVMELAHNATEYGFVNQVAYLKEALEWLSDKRFIQSNRDLIYNVADGLDLRTSTPRFIVSFSPIVFTGRLNDSWLPPNEVGFDTEKVIGSGWFNNTLALQISAMVTPEFKIINDVAYSRVYGSFTYEKISYQLEDRATYQLSSDFLSTLNPSPAPLYSISNLENINLETRNLAMSAVLKTIVKDLIFIDIEGGIMRRTGNFDFGLGNEHFAGDPEVTNLIYESSTRVLGKSTVAFGKLRTGIGYNTKKGKGVYISTGLRAFQSSITPNENYKIFQRTNDDVFKVPTEAIKPWLISLDFGIDVMF